jgi:hypothetical protein
VWSWAPQLQHSCANGAFLHFMSFISFHGNLSWRIWLEYDDQSMVQCVGIMPSCLHKARIGSR